MTKSTWIDRAAWVADRLIDLFPRDEDLVPLRVDDAKGAGLGLGHLLWMAIALRDRKLDSETKACRWLGWLQAGMVSNGLTTLEDMKELNLASGEGRNHLAPVASFQARNEAWMDECFGDDPSDLPERAARYGEESLELLQAAGMTKEQVLQLVDYVFGRPVGDPAQEMGGAKTCLAGLATYLGLDMDACGEAELARVSTPELLAKIRGKRSRRHGRGPLPGTTEPEVDLVPGQ